MFVPCRVTLLDPVAAPFTRRAALIFLMSAEKLDVMLPARIPAVSSSLRLVPTPWPAWLLTDVSELHVVCSHELWPASIIVV